MRAKPKLYVKCDGTDSEILNSQYSMMDQIIDKELDAYIDKDVFELKTDETFADLFIRESSILLEQKGHFSYGNGLTSYIEDLRKKLKDYDFWRVFTQSLQFATFVYSSGIVSELAQIAVKQKRNQSEKGSKPKTVNGITPSERKIRNDKIIEHFKKSRLTVNHFADKYAVKYGLKPRSIRLILQNALGNEPG